MLAKLLIDYKKQRLTLKARMELGSDHAVQIQGKGPGDPPPLFLDQTEARRAEKNVFGDRPSFF